MVEKETSESVERNSPEPGKAVLFELENQAVQGRQVVYDTLKALLSSKSIPFTPAMFSRHVLDSPVAEYVPALLKEQGKTRLSEEKLEAEIAEKVAAALTGDKLKLDPALKTLLDACLERGMKLGALSRLDAKSAIRLATQLGLQDMGVHVVSCADEDGGIPSIDAWLNLAKQVSVPPRLCLACATSALSLRAALAARMRPIAVPDSFSSFQDFGGADYVVDGIADLSADQLLALVEPR
jgi:beta-phosphoglucomutase-like phosphatase (HAD superfamily)